jgi:hypothetical protein
MAGILLCVVPLAASEHRGEVLFNGLPVPGATVTATRGEQKSVAITDTQGMYSFSDLADGTWTVHVEMQGFAPAKRQIDVAPNTPAAQWDLKLLPLDQIQTVAPGRPSSPAPSPGPQTAASPESKPQTAAQSNQPAKKEEQPAPSAAADDFNQTPSEGLLINGSVNNGAASPFGQFAGFGNNRSGRRGLYNGGIGVILDNSALDARPFSLTGQDTPKPAYNSVTGLATLGGPLNIPHLIRNGPYFFAAYQWTRSRDANTLSALMPTQAERTGDFSQLPTALLNPSTGQPFGGNIIPVSLQARNLLDYYPLPNIPGNAQYNYQVPALSTAHWDNLQTRLSKFLSFNNQFFGGFDFQDQRADNPNVFGFLDTTDTLGLIANGNWSHNFTRRLFMKTGYQFSRYSSTTTPFFANRENVSGDAAITGNNQDPVNWGPPSLTFTSGIAGLSDSLPSIVHNQTSALSESLTWNHLSHNITFGGDLRREQFNTLSQQNPRGAFTFNGAATGNAFADFLLGIPDTSAIAYGNADKYFRESVYDAYITDDWRIVPQLTLSAGLRWEYGAPITELYGRLVNLDIAPGYTAVAPVVANDPLGPLTGERYPASLIRPDKSGAEPRIGLAWRPLAGSSLVVRAGYGVYYDTSVYQTIATQMAQQSPLSKSFSVQNSPADPLTLAKGFNASPVITPNTYAVDPNFRVGYVQTWQLSVQRDLPGSLQMLVTYLGNKGTRGLQEFLPNTVPAGAVNPCPSCPTGFVYLDSNANSTRESGQVQLRRRLHSGFTASVAYTFAKAIDDSAGLGGQGAIQPAQGSPGMGAVAQAMSSASASVAQDWLDLSAERSLSNFDQRHLVNFQIQYTTGMGLAGGTLANGRRATLLKDWTFASQITAGSGLPETPIYPAPVTGTGLTGSIRPEYTGAPLYAAPSGLFLNPAAFTAPPAGQWGNAGRNSITGPSQFSLNASMGRTFRVNDRLNLDLRVDSQNALNHVVFTAWDTTVTSAQFGLPASANAMRTLKTTLRLRF